MGKRLLIVLSLVILAASPLWAGGWNNTLIGCRAISLGGAFAGVADDASAIFYNPAGLAFQQRDFTISINGFNVSPTHQYADSLGTDIQSKSNFTIPQLFFAFKASERLTLGFGAYVPYAGGGVEWNASTIGLYVKSYMGIMSLTPTLAYQINDKFSLGVNLNIYRGILEDRRTMEHVGTVVTEENGGALSLGIGLMFRPTERIGIGMDVRGPARMTLSGKTKVPVIVPEIGSFEAAISSETQFNLPWDFELGFSYRLSNKFLFSTGFQYTMWSALDKIEKTLKDVPLVGDQKTEEQMNFKNILLWRAGIEYWVTAGLALRGGIGIDRWATPSETLDFSNIDVDKFTLLGGLGYRSGHIQLDVVFAYAQGKEREKVEKFLGVPVQERFNLNTFILGLGITYTR
ncbi:MAG: outer membrane protein transport protein [Candidatus Aminicenantes bacterium]|jgi:long-chain fatty acid transport protein